MRLLHILLICLLTSVTLAEEVKIPVEYRTENEEPGYCYWCCIRTLGLKHKVRRLESVVQDRKNLEYDWIPDDEGGWKKVSSNGGFSYTARRYLKEKKVFFLMQEQGNFDRKILHNSERLKLGCVIGIKDYKDVKGDSHAVILTKLGKEWVSIIDPNNPRWVEVHEIAWFDQHWDGSALIIYPDD